MGYPVIERSPQVGAGFQQNDPAPGFGCGKSGGHAGDPTADNGDLGFDKRFIVSALHPVVGGDDAQAGSLSDPLHGHRPQGCGLVEDLVEKAGRHHPVQLVDE